MMAPDSRQ